MIRHLSGCDLHKLSKNKYISINKGCLIIEMILIKVIDESELTKIMMDITYSISNSIQSCLETLNKISEFVHSKLFVNINIHQIKKKLSNRDVMIVNPSPYVLNALSHAASDDDITVQEKYAYPSSLQMSTPDVLLYYLKKYLNQYVYKSESVTPDSPVITVNNKYVVDGKYNFFRHCINDSSKPIHITNMVCSRDVSRLMQSFNASMPPIMNTKIPLFRFMISPNADMIKQRIGDISVPDDIMHQFKKIIITHMTS